LKNPALTFIYCFFTFIVLVNINSHSQGWFPLTANTNKWHHSTFFVNSLTGYLSGEDGEIYKTTDGGSSWILKPSGTAYGLYTLFFMKNVNPSVGYAGGEYGLLIKTVNSGENWNTLTTPLDSSILSIYFADINTGYASSVLGKIIKTTNGGSSWTLLNTGVNFKIVNSLFFINSNLGYAAGELGLFLKTTDGGTSWINQTTQTNFYIKSLFFINDNTGYASGGKSGEGGKIFKTTNGGVNWVFIDPGTFNHLLSICFVNTNTGFASGHSGTILKTTNSGNSWFSQESGSINTLRSLCFTSIDTGYISGSFGTILKTTTGGNPIGINLINTRVPQTFSLKQNYPNPFNPLTKITFDISHKTDVFISIYNSLGEIVTSLSYNNLIPGTYETSWDAGSVSSGLYFCNFKAGRYSETKKMILIK